MEIRLLPMVILSLPLPAWTLECFRILLMLSWLVTQPSRSSSNQLHGSLRNPRAKWRSQSENHL